MPIGTTTKVTEPWLPSAAYPFLKFSLPSRSEGPAAVSKAIKDEVGNPDEISDDETCDVFDMSSFDQALSEINFSQQHTLR